MVNPRKRSFEILARAGDRRLFTAHWGSDNGDWMHALRPTDTVVFSDVSMPGGGADGTRNLLDGFGDIGRFYFLCNDYEIYKDRLQNGLNALFINQNAFVDEKVNNVRKNEEKIYDAVYNGRLVPVKRHYLAKKVGESMALALVAGRHTPGLPTIPDEQIPRYAYLNPGHVKRETVNQINNRSKVGLILSEAEGACFSSSEYLLAGIPVVSTPSRGGRDVWYDEYNSIICEPTESSVLSAVKELIANPRDPHIIREGHLRKMYAHRQKYIEQILKPFFSNVSVEECDLDSLFERLNYNRYLALQSKYSWKTVESIVTYLNEDQSIYDDEPERFEIGIQLG